MKRTTLLLISVLFFSGNLLSQNISDRTLIFNVTDSGVYKPIIWGLDLAWLSEDNVKRGIAFMGADRVDVIRSSFTPTAPLVNGDLAATELGRLNQRLNIIKLTGANTKVVLNCDHPTVDAWFKGNAARWAQLIDVTTRRHQEAGRQVITVSPFNEPDYTATGQGTVTDFYNIAGELRKNPRFDSIRISGGNTLNTDQALNWYNQLKTRLDEGNTHQLAGSFDNYANFFKTVRGNGDHATNDELHNVMEAMVGVEYGMQNGIWWGTAELARGEFVKASDGRRLAYAEHRPNWTAASVYRGVDGKIQAFGGTSERQAVTTTYSFISRDRDVYFDGVGPQREYVMTLPGGTGYQQGQTNAEKVVNITWGEDIQPVINGKYKLVNKNSGKVMEVAGGSTTSGANIQQNTYNGSTYQQWNVTPVSNRVGGDFSYFSIISAQSGKSLDILNWSLSNAGNIIMWDDAKGNNQQWFLEYAGDNCFYIRSRHSAKCIEVANNSTANYANIQQWEKDGGTNQLWRLLPVDAAIEFESPSKPTNLKAFPQNASIMLKWNSNFEKDISGYNILRSEYLDKEFSTIARNIKDTFYVDNTATVEKSYYYKIIAVDNSMNSSVYSDIKPSKVTGDTGLIADYSFESNCKDSIYNNNHAIAIGSIDYVDAFKGGKSVSMNGTNSYVRLPSTLANLKSITISSLVYWKGGANWQRIFEFASDQNNYMYLTPRTFGGQLRFAIKNGGTEQVLNASSLVANKWYHVAVTISDTVACLYLNGVLADKTETLKISLADFKPMLNYIGRGYFTSALLNANIDDFKVFNYALDGSKISELASSVINSTETLKQHSELEIWPLPAVNTLNVSYSSNSQVENSSLSIYDLKGSLIKESSIITNVTSQIDISGIKSGVYILKVNNENESLIRKITIK